MLAVVSDPVDLPRPAPEAARTPEVTRAPRTTGAANTEARGVAAASVDLAEERACVARAQAGDRAALGKLLKQYGPGLYRSVLLPRLGSEAAAKDALSETYARVLTKLHTFQWQERGFYPWLRTVALRIALDQLRAKKRLMIWTDEDVAREVDASETRTPLDQMLSDQRDRAAVREKVEAALAAIHPRYAKAIRLRILGEEPREVVAAALEVSPATFDVLLHRALAALRKQFEGSV
jgi:RNA polymerase sigma-70 factor (ECF subfamily)